MTSSKIGNNKAVLSQTINRNYKEYLLNVRLNTAIFRFVPSDGTFLLYRGRSRKPSSEMKMPLRERVAHAFSARGICDLGCPNYTPAHPFRKPVVSLHTFGWLKRGGNTPPKGGILFRELRPPFPEQGHTQSGLRADTPKDGRAFQGSPKTHPDCF